MPQIKSIQRRPPGQRAMTDRRARRALVLEREIERLFLALGEPTRRAIVEHLGREGATSISRLAGTLVVSLPAIAQHLKVLEWSGLVRTAKFGRARSCRLDPDAFRSIERWIRTCRTGWNRRLLRYAKPPNTG